MGCEVEVIVRLPYWDAAAVARATPGVRFTSLWSPSTSGAEAFVHSFLGVLYAGWRRPDVLHIHAVGPALFAPLAKLLGLRVVMTHHGPDYDREKWNKAAKALLRAGERLGVLFSDARIVISRVIGDLVQRKYHRTSHYISNGVEIPRAFAPGETLAAFGLQPGRYVLNVSRMVPEKRHLDLINAFPQAGLTGWKLVLVGDLSAQDAYVGRVAAAVEHSSNVILTGFQTGRALAEIYANAGVFVLPSTHEGLPIALLEALSHGLPSIASDIPANQEVALAPEQYLRVGQVEDLARCLRDIGTRTRSPEDRERIRSWVNSRYDWHSIASDTLEVYNRVCRPESRGAAVDTAKSSD